MTLERKPTGEDDEDDSPVQATLQKPRPRSRDPPAQREAPPPATSTERRLSQQDAIVKLQAAMRGHLGRSLFGKNNKAEKMTKKKKARERIEILKMTFQGWCDVVKEEQQAKTEEPTISVKEADPEARSGLLQGNVNNTALLSAPRLPSASPSRSPTSSLRSKPKNQLEPGTGSRSASRSASRDIGRSVSYNVLAPPSMGQEQDEGTKSATNSRQSQLRIRSRSPAAKEGAAPSTKSQDMRRAQTAILASPPQSERSESPDRSQSPSRKGKAPVPVPSKADPPQFRKQLSVPTQSKPTQDEEATTKSLAITSIVSSNVKGAASSVQTYKGGKITLDIKEAKDILAADSNGKSDPYMVVWLGKKKIFKTKVIKKTLNPVWNASCEFELAPGEEEVPVVLKLWDEDPGSISNHDYLGSVSFRVSERFGAKGGSKDWWLDIRPDEKCGRAKGQVHIIAAFESGPFETEIIEPSDSKQQEQPEEKESKQDEQQKLPEEQAGSKTPAEEVDPEAQDKEGNVKGAASPVQTHKGGKITLDIKEAKDILAADSNGKSDPYMVVWLGKKKIFKTKVIKKTLNPVWNASCEFELAPGEEEVPVVLKLWDEDPGSISNHDYLGSVSFRVSERFGAKAGSKDLWLDIRPDEKCGRAKGQVNISVAFETEIIESSDSKQQEQPKEKESKQDEQQKLPEQQAASKTPAEEVTCITASANDSPTAIVLHLEVKEDCVNEFIQVMKADAIGSRSEAGCLRFDLLRDKDNPCKFITYEVFQNAAAMDVHSQMPYVKAWGAFQYGDKKPIISKKLLKTDAINFQDKLRRAPKTPPIALVLEVEVKKECVEEFVQVMTADASGSRSEQGCLRFDLLRDKENPCKFISYEVFRSQEAMDAHGEMAYVKAWGAFQYGEKKPVVKKALIKTDAMDFQAEREPSEEERDQAARLIQGEVRRWSAALAAWKEDAERKRKSKKKGKTSSPRPVWGTSSPRPELCPRAKALAYAKSSQQALKEGSSSASPRKKDWQVTVDVIATLITQLQGAIAREDYYVAASLKAEIDALGECVPPSKRYVLTEESKVKEKPKLPSRYGKKAKRIVGLTHATKALQARRQEKSPASSPTVLTARSSPQLTDRGRSESDIRSDTNPPDQDDTYEAELANPIRDQVLTSLARTLASVTFGPPSTLRERTVKYFMKRRGALKSCEEICFFNVPIVGRTYRHNGNIAHDNANGSTSPSSPEDTPQPSAPSTPRNESSFTPARHVEEPESNFTPERSSMQAAIVQQLVLNHPEGSAAPKGKPKSPESMDKTQPRGKLGSELKSMPGVKRGSRMQPQGDHESESMDKTQSKAKQGARKSLTLKKGAQHKAEHIENENPVADESHHGGKHAQNENFPQIFVGAYQDGARVSFDNDDTIEGLDHIQSGKLQRIPASQTLKASKNLGAVKASKNLKEVKVNINHS